jgi:hypothetical protein
MVLGCLAPLILIFLLPVVGIRGTWPLAIGLGAMFVIHLFMMRGHGEDDEHDEHESQGRKSNTHAHHEHH